MQLYRCKNILKKVLQAQYIYVLCNLNTSSNFILTNIIALWQMKLKMKHCTLWRQAFQKANLRHPDSGSKHAICWHFQKDKWHNNLIECSSYFVHLLSNYQSNICHHTCLQWILLCWNDHLRSPFAIMIAKYFLNLKNVFGTLNGK